MSTVFSKNKEKRSRSSSNEANNSFVKNVTSKVTGMLPATITKWFSSPSSSNTNGSAPAADATDSSTEDEAPDPITTQPPPKRMRFNSPGKFNHFGPNDANCVPTNIDTIEQCTPYSTVQSPPGRTTFRRETNYVSTPIRASNEESIIERSERDSTTFNKSQHSVTNVGQSVATKRKSLFDSPSNREASARALKITASNTMVDPKAPCFKPSLFGSPFYPGRTMYGGASTSTYINQPNIKQRKVALVNESSSSDNTAMSHSARRVMDLLENYSSPLTEARRISQLIRSSSSSSQNDTLNSTTVSGSPYANKVLSYKTQELHVPNIATLLRLKQRSRLMDTTNAARQIIASHSSTSDYFIQPYPSTNTQKDQTDTEPSGKLRTKVKNRLTRPKRGESIDIEELPATPVNLPTAVLQIDKDNLPKFSFGIPASKLTPETTPKFTMLGTTDETDKPLASAKVGDTDLCKPATVLNNDFYKFSSPVRISSETTSFSSAPLKFTFGSPERGIDKPKPDNKKDDNPSYVIGQPKMTEIIPIPKSADWKCPDCWVSNKPDVANCVCCGAKQPSKESVKPPKCTICKLADSQSNSEKCVNCDKVQLNNNTKPNLVTADVSKWKCEDCWVSNDESADKCVCCGGKNPKSTPSAASAAAVSAVSADSEWKCEDCWIKNKGSVDKCAACGGARPGAKPNAAPALPANDFGSSMFRTDNNLKSLVKSQSDKWECTSCLVRNENNRTKCVCCDEDKPGTIKVLDNKKSFNFGTVTATSFKFGIDPKAQETSSAKLPEVKSAEGLAKPEESETNNNIYKNSANSSGSSVFGVFGKKPEDKTDATKEKEATKGFTFGIPKTQAPTETASIPVFGAPKKSVEPVQEKNDEKEKPQEVPKVVFNLPVTKESPKPLANMFVAPVTSQVNQEKPVASTPTLLNQLVSNVTTENKASPVSAVSMLPKATTSESTPRQSSFSFTGAQLKPPMDMFAAPASTATGFSTPIKSPPATSTMSLFQKPEPTATSSMFQNPNPTTSTVSLFQKTETVTTTASAPLATSTPLFSFGTNSAPSAAPQPEKPKFNFSFSNNTPLFSNNTFSATQDNSNTNKFGIPGSNLGGGGNGLSAANPLVGGNGLGTGKLGANELTSNTLSSGSEMPSGTNLFGVPAQKENLWSNNSSTNLFVSNAASNAMQKPPAFTFGSTTFNASNATPSFGANTAVPQNNPPPSFGANTAVQQNNPPPAFGANTAPAQNNSAPFGSNAPPAQSMFGMNQSASAQPSMFASPSQPAPMFGSPQSAGNTAPAMNLFGSPSVGAAPTFGSPNPSIPSFEAPSLNPAPAPAFNFGAPQHSTGVFGFGQHAQPQAQQPQQAGVYSFGAAPGAPQVQFTMGSAPSTVRRVRKAFRRNPQR